MPKSDFEGADAAQTQRRPNADPTHHPHSATPTSRTPRSSEGAIRRHSTPTQRRQEEPFDADATTKGPRFRKSTRGPVATLKQGVHFGPPVSVHPLSKPNATQRHRPNAEVELLNNSTQNSTPKGARIVYRAHTKGARKSVRRRRPGGHVEHSKGACRSESPPTRASSDLIKSDRP